MRTAKRALVALVLAAGLIAPVVGASARPSPPAGVVGIRLLDAPTSRRNDPRARLYVVDHVAPGTTIRRLVEVSNDTPRSQRVELYPAGAKIQDGSFTGLDGRAPNELSQWTTVTPEVAELAPGARSVATVSIAVPPGAPGGERYAAIWAQAPPVGPAAGEPGVTLVNRVGVRVYLSVGAGAEPRSDFAIEALAGGRRPDGTPVVTARVVNSGGRALDMSGALELRNGPGGLSAGPFPARLGTTLAVGAAGPVEVLLDKRIPAGPWEARITLSSGPVEHEARATLTFPVAAGTSGAPVPARSVEGRWTVLLLLLGLGLLLLLALLVLLWARRRRNRDAPPPGGGAPDAEAPPVSEHEERHRLAEANR